MQLDLRSTKKVAVIDVQLHRSVAIQCRLGSGATTAVVEVKQAFSPYTDGHAVSLSTTTTLTLDGSVTTTIDTSNMAYLHLDVTTADADAFADMAYELTGEMIGQVVDRTIMGDYETAQGGIAVRNWHRAYAMAVPAGAVSSGVFTVQHSVGDGFPLLALDTPVALVLDSATISEIDTSKTSSIYAVCTTLQAGLLANLYVYQRERLETDDKSGTAFPFPPYDGQPYKRIDLNNELFHWDATRGSWLGELRMQSHSYSGTASVGGWLGLRCGGAVQGTSTNGLSHMADMTIVGAELHTQTAWSGEWNLKLAGVTNGAMLNFTADSSIEDHSLNIEVAGHASDGWWTQIHVDGASADLARYPVGTVYYRNRST